MGAQASKAEPKTQKPQFRVLATSVPAPSPEFDPAAVAEAGTSSGELPVFMQQVAAIEKQRTKLPFPGLYESATNEPKGPISPDVFDGFRFDFQRILTATFSTTHSFLLGTSMVPGGLYQFGANVICGSQDNPSAVLMSKITPDGTLDARWNQNLGGNWKMRVKSMLKSEEGQSQIFADFDYFGHDFSWNMKVTNGPLFGATYFQSVTPHVALGGEAYLHAQQMRLISSYGLRYQDEHCVGTATVAAMSNIQLQYLRKVSKRAHYATELVYNHATRESHTTVGFQVQLNQSNFVSSIDQTGRVASSIETRILPNFVLSLAAEAYPAKDDFKFGYGAQLTF